MPSPTIEGLDFDDDNEEHIGRHGITPDDLWELLDNPYVIKRNRKHRSRIYLVIGRNRQGQCITMPIVATHDPFIWRPVTAWFCKQSEEAALGSVERK